MIVKKLLAAALCLSAFGAAHAESQIVNLDAWYNGGPFDREAHLRNPVLFQATQIGQYKIDFLSPSTSGASHTAWNAWGNVQNCNAQGGACSNGWMNFFRYDEVGNTDINQVKTVGDYGRWSSAELSFAKAQELGPQFINVTAPTTLRFFIADNWHNDNNGGVSFMISTPVPEAETYAMMLAGLGVLGMLARRRKSAQAIS
ncbi:PEP-CTERM sorting domain-containing protein [Massilia sp. W12]|uniref:PEP-CTERM sorting domain-containing protein n=1 Tax=Massilia sp. W12 TaxID=3126507 RepID=UPI0030CF90D2